MLGLYVLVGLVLALEAMGSGVWYTASRAYIKDIFGSEAYTFVALLVAAESIPYIISPFAGLLGDVYGRRRVALVGALRVFVIPLVALVDLMFIPIIAFIASILSVIFYTNALGIALGLTRGSGRLYGLITIAAPIAYGLGSLLPGLLKPLGGYPLVFISAGAIGGMASLTLALLPEIRSGNRWDLGLLKVAMDSVPLNLVIAILMGNLALTLYGNMMSIKLYDVAGSLLVFGFIGGFLTTILSTIVRPIAGALVDKVKADIVLASTLLAYLVYNTALYHTIGLALIILWLIPLYPFRDIAQTMALSRRASPELQGSMAGLINMLWGISAIVYPIGYILGVDLYIAYLAQAVALVIALVSMLPTALST